MSFSRSVRKGEVLARDFDTQRIADSEVEMGCNQTGNYHQLYSERTVQEPYYDVWR